MFNALDAIDLAARGESVEHETNSLDSLAGGVFVGRHAEMDQLKAALEDVLGGSGRLVTLVGEPGIGKTRTSEELATYAGYAVDRSCGDDATRPRVSRLTGRGFRRSEAMCARQMPTNFAGRWVQAHQWSPKLLRM